MTSLRTLGLLAGAVFLGAGCATRYSAPFHPPQGLFFSDYKAPLQTEIPPGGIACTRSRGSAASWYFQLYYFTFAWDNCSVAKAAESGNLERVDYADYEYFQTLFISKTTVNAYGPKKGAATP